MYIEFIAFSSSANENIDSEVGFIFNISLKVGHFEVIVDEVDDKVGEPRVLPL